MKLVVRILPILIIIALAFLTILSVGNKHIPPEESASPSPSADISPTPSEEPSLEPSPSPSVYDGPVSPLSGLPADESALDNRPYAVMINNISTAQPQLGVSRADIIYEIVVEGGITRMMALFQDVSDIGDIGSVRSARPYFVRIALGYDSIYIHAGGSEDAYSVLYSTQILHYDGVNGGRQDIFFRDAERRKTLGYEHSLLTSGQLISDYLPDYGVRLEHKEGFDCGLTFSPEAAPENGTSAQAMTVHLSSNKTTSFAYSEEDGAYYLSQFGKAYTDGNDGTQLLAVNVLVLRTSIGLISGDSEGHMSVDTTGSGSGVFFCGGFCEPITWSRGGVSEPYAYTAADGSALELSPGLTYICIIGNGSDVEIS